MESQALSANSGLIVGDRVNYWLAKRGAHGSYAELLDLYPELLAHTQHLLTNILSLGMARALLALQQSKTRRNLPLDQALLEDKGTVLNEFKRELTIAYQDLFPELGPGVCPTFFWLFDESGLFDSQVWECGKLCLASTHMETVDLTWINQNVSLSASYLEDCWGQAQGLLQTYNRQRTKGDDNGSS